MGWLSVFLIVSTTDSFTVRLKWSLGFQIFVTWLSGDCHGPSLRPPAAEGLSENICFSFVPFKYYGGRDSLHGQPVCHTFFLLGLHLCQVTPLYTQLLMVTQTSCLWTVSHPRLESPPAQGQHSGGHTVFSAPWQFGNKGTVNNSRVKCSSFRQEFWLSTKAF